MIIRNVMVFFRGFTLISRALGRVFKETSCVVISKANFMFNVRFFQAFVFFMFSNSANFFFGLFSCKLVSVFSMVWGNWNLSIFFHEKESPANDRYTSYRDEGWRNERGSFFRGEAPFN